MANTGKSTAGPSLRSGSTKSTERVSTPQVGTAPDPISTLQHALGNQAIQRLVRSGTLSAEIVQAARAGLGNQALQRLATTQLRDEEPGSEPALGQQIRAQAGRGSQLQPNVQQKLQRGLGADLSGVRVHTDGEADHLARSVNATAFTTGSDIFFRSSQFKPNSPEGLQTLAHEAVHTVQQASGPVAGTPAPGGVAISDPGDQFERAAEAQARKALAGGRAPIEDQPVQRTAAATPRLQRQVMIQRHSSFEHRLLGDVKPEELSKVSADINPKDRIHVLRQEMERLKQWQQKGPEGKDHEALAAEWGVRLVQLTGSDLLVTYGEVNTLPDYFANPEAIQAAKREVMLPILQGVRKEGYDKMQAKIDEIADAEMKRLQEQEKQKKGTLGSMFGKTDPETQGQLAELASLKQSDKVDFKGWTGPGSATALGEVTDLNAITKGSGKGGTNQYSQVLARNACHFAPFSWDRWMQFHQEARRLAKQGHDKQDPSLINQAWLNNGYADHFLQDSFAAGHLINKTMIMQWYVEWIENYNKTAWPGMKIHPDDWEQVRTMTQARQPGLAGTHLYYGTNAYRGTSGATSSTDPQTAEEQKTKQERMDVSGVQAEGGKTQEESYQSYLLLLKSSSIQFGSKNLHDKFCVDGLEVASKKGSFRVYGDENLLKGGPGASKGVFLAATAAQLSQKAIEDITTTGMTLERDDEIMDYFPNEVNWENKWISLAEWHGSAQTPGPLKAWTEKEIFEKGWHRMKDTFLPNATEVSQDMPAVAKKLEAIEKAPHQPF